jgi:predicted NodU family carbamoyl transferase
MKILGINISHDFSICVYENKIVKEIYFEDRFIQEKQFLIKNKETFYNCIFNKINFKPDVVVYSSFQRSPDDKITDKQIIKQIQKQLGNPIYYFNEKNHHLYHACSSFFFSKFEEAMSIVIDGGGACPLGKNYREIQSIFYINKKNIHTIFQHLSNYKSIFRPLDFEDEYSHLITDVYRDGIQFYLSSLCIGGLYFIRACDKINLEREPGKLMGLSSYGSTKQKYNLNYSYVDIAKKTQEKSFNETCVLIEKAYDYKKIKNFVLSGGYFLNCSNNFRYVKKYPEFNFFVDPDPSDGGTALGACVYYDNYK